MDRAVYLYCIVRRARKPPMTAVPPGVPGGTRTTAEALGDDLWLVTTSVPLDRYGGAALESSLRDLRLVSEIALAHESVVEHVVRTRGASVIPAKLFTMFSSLARAVTEMRRRRGHLERVFDRIEGCEEWGVRVVRAHGRPAVPQAARPQTGRAFLAARKQARDGSREAVRAAAEAADAAFESLSDIARDGRRRTHDAPGVVPPLLDAAFLVPRRRRARFHAAARSLATDIALTGGELTVTGPWPAYNFVHPEGGA